VIPALTFDYNNYSGILATPSIDRLGTGQRFEFKSSLVCLSMKFSFAEIEYANTPCRKICAIIFYRTDVKLIRSFCHSGFDEDQKKIALA
jgi:hypothetical protein